MKRTGTVSVTCERAGVPAPSSTGWPGNSSTLRRNKLCACVVFSAPEKSSPNAPVLPASHITCVYFYVCTYLLDS
jgi:hypothetical protein